MQALLQGPSHYQLDISHDKPRMYHHVKPHDSRREVRNTAMQEKPLLIRTPQSESKPLKRKFLVSDSPPQLDEDDRKTTPKRKKPLLNSEMSPTHHGSTPVSKAPSSGITSPRTGPLSERQQMLFLMKMTDDSQDSSSKPTSPQPSAPPVKKTPGDKKVHKRNERGETPLHLAAIKGDVKQIKKLIKAGADVNVADFAGWTPLHEASNKGWVSVTKQLLKAGANVNVQGLENDTPLHDASGNGHTELVELLLKHGANPLQPNSKGKTPVDVAASQDMVKLLRKEIIASSSDSSSLDDARSPTSPESNSSCKDDDMDIFTPRNPKSDSNNANLGPSSRKSIFIKFQREQIDEQSDKSPDFYSCHVETSENKDTLFGCDSPASSGSDLYDPQLQSDRFKSKPGNTEETGTSSTESPASKVKLPFSSSDVSGFDMGGFNRLNNLEPDSQGVENSAQKYKLKVSETQPFFPHSESFSDSESRDSFKMYGDSDRTRIPSVDSSLSRLKESASSDVQRNNVVSSVLNSCTSTTTGKSGSSGENNSVSSSSNNEQSFLQNSSNIPRRNSISSSNNFVTNSANNGNSNDLPNSSVSSSGLKWDLRSTASPKSEEGSNHSGRSDSNRNSSPVRIEGRDFKSSPRDSKPCSPKVPPLKIIIPPKTSSAISQDPESAKIHTSKKSLPYVLNPTQEQQAGGLLPQNNVTSLATPQESQPVASPASSRSSSSGCAAVSKDGEKYSGKDSKEKDSKEAPIDSQVNVESDQKSEEISSSKESKERDNSSKVKEREKEGKEKGQDDEKEKETQQTRRTLRSHTQALQQEKQKQGRPPPKDKEKDSGSKESSDKDETGSTTKSKAEDEDVHTLPRKRKGLRPKSDTAPPPPSEPTITLPTVSYEKPPNPFELYLSIRKQVLQQQNNLSVVYPKAPQGFKDYLMVSCGYVLEGKKASTLSVPMLSPPNAVQGEMKELFINQEKVRYKLRLQHLTEREKLILSLEQERIREHGRAARAMANQSLPLSVCTILRNEEIYHPMEPEQEEKEKGGRARYNGRQFLSWLKDLDDKFEKLKEDLLCRHHMEADSLYAIQKLDWEWKMKELGLCDYNANPEVDEVNVPLVQVHEFDLT
ncbi:ankyrin repeat domain-containing protein 11-like isoform X1 [Saccostrea cucullata]|uniref:ankyrin repeat domain-containing protein 11-like isoform X1 n=1 Tax=Saccostrea cuccullata TaxID=36930 RepID=UPI002ED69F51